MKEGLSIRPSSDPRAERCSSLPIISAVSSHIPGSWIEGSFISQETVAIIFLFNIDPPADIYGLLTENVLPSQQLPALCPVAA